ncbi:hypothetical protein [Microbispora rosea]|uniref:hypothetical protein n=2 Tax=Streptosporangiaceae TaxID=2004 RepID=UPI00117F4F22|nr:hypothetical protein [Microbispora rosea]
MRNLNPAYRTTLRTNPIYTLDARGRIQIEMDSVWMESMSDGNLPVAHPVSEFRLIIQEVLHTAEATCGVEDLERDLERALAVLQRNPDLRPQFETELTTLIDSIREGVVELVSFVMYELRWPVIEEAIRSRISEPRRNVSDLRLYEAMLEAFSDSWRDRDLYRKFSQ